MRKNKLLQAKGLSVLLACAMLVNSTGITSFAYEADKVPVATEESVQQELVGAASTTLTSYKLYNNKSYEIVNTTGEDVSITISSDGTIKTGFDCAKYDSDGTCTAICEKASTIYTIKNGSGKEEREVVTVNNTSATSSDYVIISVPDNVTVKESEKQALYYLAVNNHESCVITNPLDKKMPVADDQSITSSVLDYVKYDSTGECKASSLGTYDLPALDASENQKVVVTIDYDNGNTYTANLAIPYEYYLAGAKLEASEKPAWHTYTLNNHESCVITNPTSRKVSPSDSVSISQSILEYAVYNTDGTCEAFSRAHYDTASLAASENQKEIVTLNYTSANTYTAEISVPYAYYEEGVTIEKSEKPALYHYELNNHESCVITNPTSRKLTVLDSESITSYVLEYTVYNTNGECTEYGKGKSSVAALAASENEKQTVTLNYTDGNSHTTDLAIPYAYYEEGASIVKSEKPAFYHYTLNNHESCVITNPTSRKLTVLDSESITSYVLEYTVYNTNGECTEYGKGKSSVAALAASENEKQTVTLNYTDGNSHTTDLAIPYAYYEEGASIVKSEKPAFYHYTLNNHESCVITNPTSRKLEIADGEGLTSYVFEFAKYSASGDCNAYGKSVNYISALAAGENEKEIVTLNYTDGNVYTSDIAIPYAYYEEGAKIEKTDVPAFYSAAIKADGRYRIVSKTSEEFTVILSEKNQVCSYSILKTGGLQKTSNISTKNDVSVSSGGTKINLGGNYEMYVQASADNTADITYSIPYELVSSGKAVVKEVTYDLTDVTTCGNVQQVAMTITNAALTKEEQTKTDTDLSLLNYSVDLYNVSQDMPIHAYSLKANTISISETEAKIDDEIRITLTADNNVTYEAVFALDSDEILPLDLLEKGYIRFITDGNKDISKIRIFDEAGSLVQKINSIKSSGTTDSTWLTAGKYQVLLINKGDTSWSVDSLEELKLLSYVEGVDYTILNVEVQDTIITKVSTIEETVADNVMVVEDGKKYWYEGGVKQGTEGRGKEIFDPATDAWYWLDAVQGGAVATDKDVYQESNGGKWVRYDSEGHMIKGWDTNENGTYYFDLITGAMLKGVNNIDGQDYRFNEATGTLYNNEFYVEDEKRFWYENGILQGTEGRGKEIYDPTTDAWYWLDAVDGGKVATSKDVYQESYAGEYADREDGTGKWVRYDENGRMIKGWSEQNGNTYYFDLVTGAMAKGEAVIDGVTHYFDINTGALVY